MRTLTLLALTALSLGLSAQPRPDQPANNEPRADVMGRVVAVSGDLRTITIAIPPREASNNPNARPEEKRINLNDRTKMLFFGVTDGEARPAVGQMAMIWLEPGSSDIAARARFMKREGEERPDVQGRIKSINGQTLIVETRDRDPATGAEKVTGETTVRIAPYTYVQYFGVEKDGAKPTAEYLIVGWFEKGSKDTLARVRLLGPGR